jgi:hypothetical protein
VEELNLPKVIDRRKWILLPDGQNQTGWLEKAGATMYGCVRTHWRLPDGTERTWRERLDLGQQSMGVKAAERLLIDKIRECFVSNMTATGLPPKGTPDTTFAWLLEKVKESRSPDWKANTARINGKYLKIIREKLGHIPIRDFATVEMQDYLRGWLHDLAAKELSRSYIQHVRRVVTPGQIDQFGRAVRFKDYLEFVSDRHCCLPLHFIPQSHEQVKRFHQTLLSLLTRHRKMEQGGHFNNRNYSNKATKLAPKQRTCLRRDVAEEYRRWLRRDASFSRRRSSLGARWRAVFVSKTASFLAGFPGNQKTFD